MNPLWILVGMAFGLCLGRIAFFLHEERKEKNARARRDNPRNWSTVRLSAPCRYCGQRSSLWAGHDNNFDVVSRFDRAGIYSVRYCSFCNGATYKSVTTNEVIKEPPTKRWTRNPTVAIAWPRPE